MPSEPMNIQEQGFRSSLFGFDKNDVLAYMNALANEAQQHELEYNRQLQQLQSKLDELRSERSTADSRMDALKAELAAATQRADTAEAKRREADEQLETIKKKTASFQSTQRESQKNANIWQLKCHDLQQLSLIHISGRCAPQTAGALIAQTVLAILEERDPDERSTAP